MPHGGTFGLRGIGYGFSRWSTQELRDVPFLPLNPVVASDGCLQVVEFGGNLAAGGAGADDAILVLSDGATCVTVVEAA